MLHKLAYPASAGLKAGKFKADFSFQLDCNVHANFKPTLREKRYVSES